MSGIEFNTRHVRASFQRFLDQVRESYRKEIEKRELKAEKKKEIKQVREAINRSHVEMAKGIRKSMSDADRQATERIEKELEQARNELSGLEMDLADIDKRIKDTEEKARVSVGSERRALYDQLDKAKKEKVEAERKAEEIRGKVKTDQEEILRLVRSVSDEMNVNRQILINDIHSYANSLLDHIHARVNYDAYCDYAYTEGMIMIEEILKGASADTYHLTMAQLKELDRALADADAQVECGVRSYVTIDGIVRKLRDKFRDRPGCRFSVKDAPTAMTEVRMEFRNGDRVECVTVIKMTPDGKGGFRSSLVNVTPGVSDRRVHDEICKRYCKLIGDEAELDIDYDRQAMTDEAILKADAERRRDPGERAAATRKWLRDRISKVR